MDTVLQPHRLPTMAKRKAFVKWNGALQTTVNRPPQAADIGTTAGPRETVLNFAVPYRPLF